MIKIATLCASLVLGLAFASCSESSAAEADKTPAEVQAEASEMDKAALEAKIDEYNSMIAGLEGDVKSMASDASDALTGGLDSLKEAGEDLAGEGSEIKDTLMKLQSNLKIYTDELAKK